MAASTNPFLCNRCDGTIAWKLGDGRLECKACHKRHRRQARLKRGSSPMSKLVRAFVLGRTAYQASQDLGLSLTTVTRRYGQIRRACLIHCEVPTLDDIEVACRSLDIALQPSEWPRLVPFKVRFRKRALVIEAPTADEVIAEAPRIGRPHRQKQMTSWVYLRRSRTRIITPRPATGRPSGREMTSPVPAWMGVVWRLSHYRSLPLGSLPLYLAEGAWLYNHRNAEDIISLLLECLEPRCSR